MSGSVYLVGADEVANAGLNMRNAADTMEQASHRVSDALYRHQQFMDDWLSRLEAIMTNTQKG